MSVGLLIVSHGRTGEALIEAAHAILGGAPHMTIRSFPVTPACDTHTTTQAIRKLCEELNSGAGVLILSDLYGSTPCNISTGCYQPGVVHTVSGISLAMLIKVMNYHDLELAALTQKAVEGGRNSVMECRT